MRAHIAWVETGSNQTTGQMAASGRKSNHLPLQTPNRCFHFIIRH
jgi:hypothetical protein